MEDIPDLQVEKIGKHLDGRRITICVTGGIAAIETPKIARQLRRYGAEVKAIMTPSAEKIITSLTLEWATGNPVITDLSGKAEHIELSDLVLIAPATLNTINKIAYGIADNSATTTIASAMGRETPVVIAPTMHESLYNNPILQETLQKLQNYENIKIIPPRMGEGKAKIAKNETIVVETIRTLSRSPLKNKKILITAGPTPGKIDDVRMITNRFRGRLGIEIAKEAYLRGMDVKLILGASGLQAPSYIDTTRINDFDQYYSEVDKELNTGYEIGIFAAAVADYLPAETKKGKIPSRGAIKSIELKETPKVIEEVRNKFPDLYMVTFKYEIGASKERLEEIAKDRIGKGYQLIVANRGEDMATGIHTAIIVDKSGIIAEPKSKTGIAASLLDILERGYQPLK